MEKTSKQYKQTKSPIPTYGVPDSLVKTFLSLDKEKVLKGNEVRCFLKSLGCSKAKIPKIDLSGLSLKMLEICYPLIKGGTLREFALKWPDSAMISNTDYSIQKISDYLTIDCEFSLSLTDILEKNVDLKYFLSEQATEKILSESSPVSRDKESTTLRE